MREFIELSRQLNFTSTAKTLHITQPGLSNHIRSLERVAGTMLVERSPKGTARLTPAGQSFLEMAGKIVALYDATVPALRGMQKEISGRLTVRSPRNECSRPLLDYIYEFCKENPKVDVVILPWSDADGIDDVASGAVDFGYVGQTFLEGIAVDEEWISFVPYAEGEVFLWLDQTYCSTDTALSLSSNLRGHQIIIPANKKRASWETTITSLVDHFRLECSLTARYCDSLEDLMLNKISDSELMLVSDGWTSFPPILMRKERVLRSFDPPVIAPYTLCFKDHSPNPAVEAFAEFLRRKFDAQE